MTAGRVAAILLAVVLSATGCHGKQPHAAPVPSFSPNPARSELVQRADLAPCPRSTAAAVPGGLPDVTLPCLGAGPAVRLTGVRGRPMVLNIWASWCGPCQKETPYFAQAYDALKARVLFLGVDDEDDPDSALDFAAHVRPPMRYPSVVDENKKVLLAMQASGPVGVPSTVFVSASGHVLHRTIVAYTSAASLRADIAHYLGVT